MTPERLRVVEEIFEAAASLPPEDRSEFVKRACADDVALSREVETLLAAKSDEGFPYSGNPTNQFRSNTSLSHVGQRIGSFVITREIGRGGMGTVYLATDTRLQRKVAIKLLPDEFTSNTDRVRRLHREARAASALNHPNIITIYEIGEVDGLHYIIEEYVEGVTLRKLVNDGGVRMAEALDIASQVASALKAAHATGIVHRDIKPENIMLRPDGIVKVLDFGLAKLDQPASHEATFTNPGTVVGTPKYMSPEQRRGEAIDSRSDLYSLGMVLEELVAHQRSSSGRRVIEGSGPSFLAPFFNSSKRFDRILTTAHAENPGDRFQTASHLEDELRKLRQDIEPRRDSRSSLKTASRYLLLAAMAVGALSLWWSYHPKPEAPGEPSKITSWVSEPGDEIDITCRISPDGKMVVYCRNIDNTRGVWVQQLPNGEPRRITQEDYTYISPAWSPDSQRIAFISNRDGQYGIWIAPLLGGRPELQRTVDTRCRRIIGWSPTGEEIYYSIDWKLFALNLKSRDSRFILQASGAVWPEFALSKDGTSVAYLRGQDGKVDLWVRSLANGTTSRITNDGVEKAHPLWHPDGKRIFFNSKYGRAQQISVANLSGSLPVAITASDNDVALCDISADGGNVLYATLETESNLWCVDWKTPGDAQLTADVGPEFWPDVSTGDGRIVYQASSELSLGPKIQNCSIMTMPLGFGSIPLKQGAKGLPQQLVANGFQARFSPGGKLVAFLRLVDMKADIWVINSTGGQVAQLTSGGIMYGPFSVLPYTREYVQDFCWDVQGQDLVYSSMRDGASNIWKANLQGEESKLTDNKVKDQLLFSPIWSPDGHSVAYTARNPDGENVSWSIKVTTQGQTKAVFESNSPLRLLGWSASGGEVIIKSTLPQRDRLPRPSSVAILQASVTDGSVHTLPEISSAYFSTVTLSGDKRFLAYVSEIDGENGVWVRPTNSSRSQKVTRALEPRTYISSLAWTPDGGTILYARQVNRRGLRMLTIVQ